MPLGALLKWILRKKLRKDELKRMQKDILKISFSMSGQEEKRMRKYLQSLMAQEDFESSCMAAEEQYTREVEDLATTLEAENLEAMRQEEQRLWEAGINDHLGPLTCI